jgi:hypothetical protein
VYEHYWNIGFEQLHSQVVTQCLKSRGLELEVFNQLVELFSEMDSGLVQNLQHQIEVELKDFYTKQNLKSPEESIEKLIKIMPAKGSKIGQFPHVKPVVIFSIVELIYQI